MGSEYRQLPGFAANFAGAPTNIERDAPAASTPAAVSGKEKFCSNPSCGDLLSTLTQVR